MQQDDFAVYTSYPYPQQYTSSASVGVLDTIPVTSTTGEHIAFQPPPYPPEPVAGPPIPPRRRPSRAGAILLLTLVLVLIFGVGLFAGWEFTSTGGSNTTAASHTTATATATSSSSTTLEAAQEAAIAKIEPSVVEVLVTTAQGTQLGSGVIIDSKGDIVTNNHVVSGAQNIAIVLSNGSTEQGQLVGTVAADDLAVVRIAPFAHMTVAQIANSSSLAVGQEVLAIGNPLGITETATKGIVSALNRSVTESTGATIFNAIQTDAAINPGNSGGALINLQGQLVGIPTLTAINTESNTAANGLSFAIPSNLVETVLQQILQ
ncbi:MAG TPA: trypsin-like peptidase domain-containing protein [Ktedonobacteraceae bacterium]|nr:trypsin-like peptidase domain-containing protein [Ktedonobacteraceae bacterium]